MSKHVAIYLRVSSKQQDTASQEPDLDRWAAAQQLPVKWYRDKFTGKTMDRPGWNKLEAAMRRGEVATVACWRLDRLGRTAKGLTALFDELPKLRVNLVSIREGIDLSTPAGRLMANVLASVAQYETEVRAERVLVGQAKAREQGKRWGGSRKGRRIWVNEDQVATVHRMVAERSTIAAIARATGLSRVTVYRLLGEASINLG
jgi:DNA invertase Pin-like site-specific DNA recombinase